MSGETVTPAGLSSRDKEGALVTPLPQSCTPDTCTYRIYGQSSHYDHGSYHAAERTLADLNRAWFYHATSCRDCSRDDDAGCRPEQELTRLIEWLECRVGLRTQQTNGR